MSLPTDDVVMKSVFRATREHTKKCTRPIRNSGVILNQFLVMFKNRTQVYKI